MTNPKHVRRSKAKRRRRTLIILGSVVLVLVLIAAAGAGYVFYRNDQIHRISVGGLKTVSDSSSTSSENILLVGNNSRCVLKKDSKFYAKNSSHFGTCSEVGGGRSDVTMVVHLDPAKHTAYLLSIPRDLWLPVPGGNGLEMRVDDELNTAEDSYLHMKFGPSFLVKTIEDDLGIPINHYVELNFYTFEHVVNTLGGITLDFPTELRDYYSGLDITKTGCQHLDGTQALALVRARHLYYYDNGVWKYDGTGDLGRIIRTHIFLRNLADQIKGSLTDPLKANAVLGSILPNLEVDKGFGLSQLLSLALDYKDVSVGAVPTDTLPVIIPNGTFIDTANPTSYQAPGSIVLPFEPSDQTILNAFMGSSAPKYENIAPSSTTVSVLNATGTYDKGQTVATQLKALGFSIDQVGNTTNAGLDSETVVRYAPGHILDADRVASELQGQVIIGKGPSTMTSDVTITVGSTVSVSQPASSTSTTSSTSNSATTQVKDLAKTNLWTATHPASEFWWDPKSCPAS